MTDAIYISLLVSLSHHLVSYSIITIAYRIYYIEIYSAGLMRTLRTHRHTSHSPAVRVPKCCAQEGCEGVYRGSKDGTSMMRKKRESATGAELARVSSPALLLKLSSKTISSIHKNAQKVVTRCLIMTHSARGGILRLAFLTCHQAASLPRVLD